MYLQGRTKQFAVVKKLNFPFVNIFSVKLFTGNVTIENIQFTSKSVIEMTSMIHVIVLPKTYIIHYAILVLRRIAVTIWHLRFIESTRFSSILTPNRFHSNSSASNSSSSFCGRLCEALAFKMAQRFSMRSGDCDGHSR